MWINFVAVSLVAVTFDCKVKKHLGFYFSFAFDKTL